MQAISTKKNNLAFWLMVLVFILVSFYFYDRPQIAMWIGFCLAGYSAIANDSIQTLGTFIASNQKRPWYVLWLFIGTILVLTIFYSWYQYSGDISYERLTKIEEPKSFTVLHLLAPVALIIVTRLRMPVSTTFLLLSVFSEKEVIGDMLTKSFIGYFVAFVVALGIWAVIAQMQKRKIFFKENYNKKAWTIFQWFTTSYLWISWLMQDIANTAVFLPRKLPLDYVIYIALFLFLIMGLILYLRGGRIQSIITEKTDVVDVRAATFIDIIYATILLIFKELNNLPMSTTWVFLGLLAGREISLAQISGNEKPYLRTLGLVMKDIALASIGLIISLLIAIIARNDFSFSDIRNLFASVF